MSQVLETERLTLREFIVGDSKFIVELLNSPGWIQFIGDRNIKTEGQAIAYLENGPIKSYRENGFGLCLVERKSDKKAIGMCGVMKRDTLEIPDIGFAFLPAFTGNGYASEVVEGMLLFAKNKLDILKICAITLPDNIKSIRVLERSGLRFRKPIHLPHSEKELLLFSN
jgi:RimJ/RimL family protein N-acetyltransferase